MSMFLESGELSALTGRKMKSQQIGALRQMGIPFFVSATGHAVVTRIAIEGGKTAEKPKREWTPDVMKGLH
ncbi:DUF4224 domain-containing protein [Glaciimonas soli]|uniref:DUF4224 domain-containing protein n=1 Tax=Glaciimonas soli TaxID=2590999 RepID=A0A843YT37_9BURK|nr:DUF4224 domain-containing protein [Glaciimonas soli]MQR02350.1 DUF4224 domain-containing protein [Glaciimonas soli]